MDAILKPIIDDLAKLVSRGYSTHCFVEVDVLALSRGCVCLVSII